MELEIPSRLAEKAHRFPEWSYGATKVTLILADGRRIDDVFLSVPVIVKVGQRMVSAASDLDFTTAEIAAVVRHDRPSWARLRQGWQWLRHVTRC